MLLKTRAAIFLLIFVIIISFPLTLVFAQEGDQIETFDDETLPGWEHSEGVSVSEGVVILRPENFMIKFYEFPGNRYSFDIKTTGPGVSLFRYAIGEGGEYALIIHDEAIVLEHAQEGGPIFLGETPWEPARGEWQKIEITLGPESHQISLNGNSILTTEETEFLSGGGVGIWVEGESAVEFDNLSIEGVLIPDDREPGGEPPAEEVAVPGQEDIPDQTEDPGAGRLSIDDLINELTSTQANPTQLGTFLVNLGLSVILSYILSRVYVHWGSSLSNRRRFAANFILITVTTTFIILVVRSSVALSLGLVGALSIVRFRSAIKEPEELAYLFFAIAIGIGLGDNQRLITVIALAVAILVLGIMRLFRGRQADFNLHLTVSSENPSKVELEPILDTVKANSTQMKLMRFDDSGQALESSFLVEFRDMEQLRMAKTALRELSESLTITFLDNKGIW